MSRPLGPLFPAPLSTERVSAGFRVLSHLHSRVSLQGEPASGWTKREQNIEKEKDVSSTLQLTEAPFLGSLARIPRWSLWEVFSLRPPRSSAIRWPASGESQGFKTLTGMQTGHLFRRLFPSPSTCCCLLFGPWVVAISLLLRNISCRQ